MVNVTKITQSFTTSKSNGNGQSYQLATWWEGFIADTFDVGYFSGVRSETDRIWHVFVDDPTKNQRKHALLVEISEVVLTDSSCVVHFTFETKLQIVTTRTVFNSLIIFITDNNIIRCDRNCSVVI